MSLILYVQSLVGILFVIRTLQLFRARALLSPSTVTKIGTIFVCASLSVSFYCVKDTFLAVLLNFGTTFFMLAILFVCERRQIDALKGEVALFLDRWILNLRIGSALSTARNSALSCQSECFQSLLRPIFAAQSVQLTSQAQTRPHGPNGPNGPNKLNVSNRRNGRGGLREHLLMSGAVLSELERIHSEPHAALTRLENLRQVLRKTSEFRRKSGQATRQAYIQSVVMVVLLLALVTFTIHRYGWWRSSDLVIGALVLSILGVFMMLILARKTRWKI